MPRPGILIIDDERNFREFLAEALETEGYDVSIAASARAGVALAREKEPGIILLDQNLPDQPGHDILPTLRQLDVRPTVIMITAYAEYSRAVAAVKAGAHHYLTKPFDFGDLLAVLDELRGVGLAPNAPSADDPLAAFVGVSPQMQEVERQIWQVATSGVGTVLIRGESGTGKELTARAIHALSDRQARRLVSVNCATLTETLLMSELFGHERGAFTDARERKKGIFELAHGGTVFLDEVGELTPRAQAALLRVLEERVVTRVGGSTEIPVDVRVLAATNRPLEERVRMKKFRADLYYRLNVVEIALPPLRNRPEDILPLFRHFARLFAQKYGGPVRTLSPKAEERLMTYPWPGNVRELRNAIERAYIVSPGPTIGLEDLPKALRDQGTDRLFPGIPLQRLPFREAKEKVIDHFERVYLTKTLTRVNGNISRAARRTGLQRQALQRLLRKHGLKGRDFRK